MIELLDVEKTYYLNPESSVAAVRGVDLLVSRGSFLMITGRSGSGKTTLLNLAAGLAKPTAGKVLWDGVDFWSLSDRQQSHLRNEKVGFIFQFPSLLPTLTVLENVSLPATFHTNGTRGSMSQRGQDLLETVGLQDKLYAYPRQLSAGQQQRVVVARALVQSPEILLADEPTSNLDEQTEREIMEFFQDLNQRTGITIVMVTHTRQLVRYGTHSVEMADGRVREEERVV